MIFIKTIRATIPIKRIHYEMKMDVVMDWDKYSDHIEIKHCWITKLPNPASDQAYIMDQLAQNHIDYNRPWLLNEFKTYLASNPERY